MKYQHIKARIKASEAYRIFVVEVFKTSDSLSGGFGRAFTLLFFFWGILSLQNYLLWEIKPFEELDRVQGTFMTYDQGSQRVSAKVLIEVDGEQRGFNSPWGDRDVANKIATNLRDKQVTLWYRTSPSLFIFQLEIVAHLTMGDEVIFDYAKERPQLIERQESMKTSGLVCLFIVLFVALKHWRKHR